MLQMSPGGMSNCGASMGRTNEVLMTEKSLCTAFAHCKLQGPSESKNMEKLFAKLWEDHVVVCVAVLNC